MRHESRITTATLVALALSSGAWAQEGIGCCGQGGPCDRPHGGFGCDDASCCRIVCEVDPLCCGDGMGGGGWDQHCVELSQKFCGLQLATCEWDLSGDGVINTPDLLALLAQWGPGCDKLADFDCDCQVGNPDLLELLALWGQMCPGDCSIVCPPGAQMEAEVCGASTNLGCVCCDGDRTMHAEPISLGTVCGTLWAAYCYADKDVYLLDLTGLAPGPYAITFNFQSELPAELSACPPTVCEDGPNCKQPAIECLLVPAAVSNCNIDTGAVGYFAPFGVPNPPLMVVVETDDVTRGYPCTPGRDHNDYWFDVTAIPK